MNQMRNKLWRRDKDKDRQTRQMEAASASTPASSTGWCWKYLPQIQLEGECVSSWSYCSTCAEANGAVPVAEYTYDTPESQLRNLGDLTYLLGDFDAAAASYRILIADWKSDKSRKNLASAYEYLGNSLIGNVRAVRWVEARVFFPSTVCILLFF